jgi:glycine cleavage system pyridoxal-binding protein P
MQDWDAASIRTDCFGSPHRPVDDAIFSQPASSASRLVDLRRDLGHLIGEEQPSRWSPNSIAAGLLASPGEVEADVAAGTEGI